MLHFALKRRVSLRLADGTAVSTSHDEDCHEMFAHAVFEQWEKAKEAKKLGLRKLKEEALRANAVKIIIKKNKTEERRAENLRSEEKSLSDKAIPHPLSHSK